MPSDPDASREYMRVRYRARRKEAIKRLGGKCSVCGTRRNLEIDHIDPKQKAISTARMTMVSRERFEVELVKCQLLCKKHHGEKTLRDLGRKSAREMHGTISSYNYCRCAKCKAAKAECNRRSGMTRKLKRAAERAARALSSIG